MIIKTESDFQEALRIIDSSELLAFDVETTGLNTRKAKCIGIGVCNEKLKSFYLPLLSWNAKDQVLLDEGMFEEVQLILKKLQTKKLIAHNSYFDAEIVKNNFQIDLWDSLYLDTIMLIHTVQETGPFGLKQIAKQLWGIEELEQQKLMAASIKANGGGGKGEIYKADVDLIGQYCEKDCQLTIRVMQHFLPKLREYNLENFFFNEEVMPLYKTVTKTMQQRGIPVNVPLLLEARTEIAEEMDDLEDKIQEAISDYVQNEFKDYYLNKEYPPSRSGFFAQEFIKMLDLPLPRTKGGQYSLVEEAIYLLPESHGKQVLEAEELMTEQEIRQVQERLLEKENIRFIFNIQSKHHWKRFFFIHLKEKSETYTPTGQPQFEEEFLEAKQEKYPFLKDLLVYNKLMKIKGTYIDRFLEEQEDGIFYPDFKQHATVTGRYGSDLQQLSRKITEGDEHVIKYTNLIRDFFIASPEHSLVGADFSQLEICVFASDAGDETLLNMIRNKEDFYSRVAIDIYGLNELSANKKADNFLKNKRPELRQMIKAVALGIRYGLESFKLHHDLNISQEEAEQIVRKYFQAYPKLAARMEELKEQAINKGYVQTKTGRRRHIEAARSFVKSYGLENLNPLELYKNYGNSNEYSKAKELRSRARSAINAAYNFPIQSMAASIVNRASVAIQKEFEQKGLSSYICLQVHDEIVCHCLESEAELVKEIMQRNMETVVQLDIPLEAIPTIGKIYGELK